MANLYPLFAVGLPCENKFCQQVLDYSPLNFWWDGGAAVSMFFVLSSLVLSRSTLVSAMNNHLPADTLAC